MPEESYIRELERQIGNRDDQIKSSNDTIARLSTANEQLHLRVTIENNKVEQLTQ
jgi:hypothetical protein